MIYFSFYFLNSSGGIHGEKILNVPWPVGDLPGDLRPVPPKNCPGRDINTANIIHQI